MLPEANLLMHILLIHQAFTSPKEAGGTRHFELGKRLLKAGHRFSIIASDLSYLSGKSAVEGQDFITLQECEGISVVRAYTYPALHRNFMWRVASFLSFMFTSVLAARSAGAADIVMGTSPPMFQALSAWLVSAIRRRPFLLEIRDLWPDFAIDMGVLRNPILIELSRWLERFLYDRATHLLVNSPAYRDYLIQKGIPKNKISLVPNGVETEMFDPIARGYPFREKWHLQNRFVVTYAGALGMANDIETLLRAANLLGELKKIHFLLVGDGMERPNLERMVRERGLKNVTFTGALPKSEMPEVLAASDACVAILKDISMFRTTYPNKVFDYMAAGRPTILAIDGVIREVVEAAEGGIFVPPGDELSLAKAIKALYFDQERSQGMGRAARNYVTKHFHRRDQAQRFVKLIEDIGNHAGCADS